MPTDPFIAIEALTDLRGPLALPFDDHFVATTIEALDYSRRNLTFNLILQALRLPPWNIPVTRRMEKRLQTFIYRHTYDDEWKRELHTQLQNSAQWREALIPSHENGPCTPSSL